MERRPKVKKKEKAGSLVEAKRSVEEVTAMVLPGCDSSEASPSLVVGI